MREGVILDSTTGALGFRNHTVPTRPRINHGATWTEDLLWIEPVTVCVDTNWTIRIRQNLFYIINSGPSGRRTTEISLVNEGFYNSFEQKPRLPSFNMSNSQISPDLRGRATLAAYVLGYRVSNLLQLTPSNGSIGMSYKLMGPGPRPNLSGSLGTASDKQGLSLGNLVDSPSRFPFSGWL